ncbi:MarR family winged helix-turn-helix transcriptional regulator [Salipiger aestuarii]|uniref:DNA-binding MarR family transcriptional regulator n=1 Tax=Salipiger aestuarii TaxID=568098 RepID=A0A327XX34_9RHOB|nr:MarR family transcriptional regulator [Citreicella sp. 357]RAK13300.1 DNA-binding MarR family transcriptional regulator [Salipiger aestuarii]
MSAPGNASKPPAFAADACDEVAYNRVWFNLMRIQRSLGPKIARALRDEGLDDPVWYEILLELERAGPGGVAMADLEGRLFMPQYALSRHAQRLESTGWISRSPRPGPGRGQILALTPEGLGVHRRIWTVYETAIRAQLESRMTTDEAYALSRMLIRLYP